MASPPPTEFGKRKPAPIPAAASPPVKRSSHVALLLTGTLAVGGSAYAADAPRKLSTERRPGNDGAGIAGSRCRLRVARFFVEWQPWRFERLVVTQQLLQRRFVIVRNIGRFWINRNDARRFRRLCAGLCCAFFRQLTAASHEAASYRPLACSALARMP
jgi:hypothetical protein